MPSVARIVGITIANMIPVELSMISRSAEATGPFGSSTPPVQPASVAPLIRMTTSRTYSMLDLACVGGGRAGMRGRHRNRSRSVVIGQQRRKQHGQVDDREHEQARRIAAIG